MAVTGGTCTAYRVSLGVDGVLQAVGAMAQRKSCVDAETAYSRLQAKGETAETVFVAAATLPALRAKFEEGQA